MDSKSNYTKFGRFQSTKFLYNFILRERIIIYFVGRQYDKRIPTSMFCFHFIILMEMIDMNGTIPTT